MLFKKCTSKTWKHGMFYYYFLCQKATLVSRYLVICCCLLSLHSVHNNWPYWMFSIGDPAEQLLGGKFNISARL